MKRVLFISVFLMAVIIGGWYMFVGRPIQGRIAEADMKIGTEEKKLKSYHQALARFEDRIKEYNQFHITAEKANHFGGRCFLKTGIGIR